MKLRVWSKQHRSVLRDIEEWGYYRATRARIKHDKGQDQQIILFAYDWLAQHAPNKPADAHYPIWLSFAYAATMLPSPDEVVFELKLDSALVTPININKWGTILNYGYIPQDEADAQQHRQLLKTYNTNNATAMMSEFYPEIKRKTLNSWPRLFDEHISLGSDSSYGIIWELKAEWIQKIIRSSCTPPKLK